MKQLTPGANAPVTEGQLGITVRMEPPTIAGLDVDVSAFLLGSSGKVRGDQDMVFYGQKAPGNGAVELFDQEAGATLFQVDLPRVEAVVEKIAFTATIYENKASFSSFGQLRVTVQTGGNQELEALIDTQGMSQTALILGEFYRRNGTWKFRAVGQGFNGGLQPLAEHFGVEVAQPQTQAAPPPPPEPKPAPQPAASSISLSKVTLDKSRRSISLDKRGDSFGEIKINLNWNRGNDQRKGLLGGLFGAKGVDLDLGCLFELNGNQKGGVQALGNAFGNFHQPPYIELKGDDRTGSVAGGEWMRINGGHWNDIRRILVFAFIYEGIPNWAQTDGVVTLYVPEQPPIEIPMSEGSNRLGMCAVALLENIGGSVQVSRENRYFSGHRDMDRAYNWGLAYQAGSK